MDNLQEIENAEGLYRIEKIKLYKEIMPLEKGFIVKSYRTFDVVERRTKKMEIKTKFEIGEKVWCIQKSGETVQVYADTILNIIIQQNTNSQIVIFYYMKETDYELTDDEIVTYEDTEKLAVKVKELWEEIEG